MHELLMAHGSVRTERDGWMDDNTRGLSLAAAAEWDEAAEAFAAAADVVARRAPDVSSHDALALILGNLAHACFRAGRTRDAILHAQRACALRVALTGEDAMPVARERMDLAVMLGASGRLDEARALIQRAISAVELHVGDEDARLGVMLENAARLALAAGDPANAEPLLIRLHALLDAHGMSTVRADRLLEMVAAERSRADANRLGVNPVAPPVLVASAAAIAADESDAEVAVPPHVSIDEHHTQYEWDDQPLRDAVVITEILLRTTPSGVVAIPAPVHHDAEILAAFDMVVETPVEPMIELSDDLPLLTDGIALDLADDFDLALTADEVSSMALGFTSDHGVGASEVPAEGLDARIDLLGLELDDALAESLTDALVNVPTHRPALELVDTTPAPRHGRSRGPHPRRSARPAPAYARARLAAWAREPERAPRAPPAAPAWGAVGQSHGPSGAPHAAPVGAAGH